MRRHRAGQAAPVAARAVRPARVEADLPGVLRQGGGAGAQGSTDRQQRAQRRGRRDRAARQVSRRHCSGGTERIDRASDPRRRQERSVRARGGDRAPERRGQGGALEAGRPARRDVHGDVDRQPRRPDGVADHQLPRGRHHVRRPRGEAARLRRARRHPPGGAGVPVVLVRPPRRGRGGRGIIRQRGDEEPAEPRGAAVAGEAKIAALWTKAMWRTLILLACLVCIALIGWGAFEAYDRSTLLIWDGAFDAHVELRTQLPLRINAVSYISSSNLDQIQAVVAGQYDWDFPRLRPARDFDGTHFTAQIECGGTITRFRMIHYGHARYLLVQLLFENGQWKYAYGTVPPHKPGDPSTITIDLDNPANHPGVRFQSVASKREGPTP